MHDGASAPQGADRELERFLARRSPDGLLRRYCTGRVIGLPTRVALTAFCFPVLLSVSDLRTCLLMALLVTAADLVECAVLRLYARQTVSPGRTVLRIAFSGALAGLQALSVVVFALTFISHAGPDGRFFALAVLSASILDAGLHFGLHRGAALVRIGTYLAGGAWLFMPMASAVAPHGNAWFLDFSAAILSLYIVWAFARMNHKGRERADSRQRVMLETSRALEVSNEALRESRAATRRLALIAERVDDAIIVTDTDGRITWVNAAFGRLTGYTAQEALGSHVTMLDGPQTDAATVARLAEARKSQAAVRTEIVNHRKDGTPVWVETSLTPMFDHIGAMTGMISVERDITRAKERQRALAEARATAEAAVAAKHTFLATMSHEIRTPMNGVIGTAELLLETPLDPAQRALAETITRSGEALLTIVDDVLDFSRLEAGKLTVASVPFDLRRCLTDVHDLVRPLAAAKGLSLTLRLPEQLPERLAGDAGRVRQVLLNLLGNAIKFTEAGVVSLHVTADLARSGACALTMVVRDTGIGIPQDRLERIFDSFTQADTSIAGRYGGTGLGLAIARLLAVAMGGDLSVRSESGVGSAFTFALTLPVAEAAPVATAPSKPAPALSDVTLLVADDNRTNLLLLERMLGPLGATLVIATNGREAVDLWAEREVDAILMDMRMPVLDGLGATREIRAAEAATGRARVPIVALTANAFAEDQRLCAESGMDEHVSKPFRKAQLLSVLARHLPSRDADTAQRSARVS